MIKPGQRLRGARFGGQFWFEGVRGAFEAELAHVAQNCILAWEIAEESRLADFENFDDVIDTGSLIALFAEQSYGRVDDLLTQPRLLAFAKPWELLLDLHRRTTLHQLSALPPSLRYGNFHTSHSPIFS